MKYCVLLHDLMSRVLRIRNRHSESVHCHRTVIFESNSDKGARLISVVTFIGSKKNAISSSKFYLTTIYLPILWMDHSCWQRGQRLFCLTQSDMQQ